MRSSSLEWSGSTDFSGGRVAALRAVFASFNEPFGPIPAEITSITSNTDGMVA